MDLQISYNFNQSTSYTLTNGIPQAGGSNFEVRIVNCANLIRFSSNVTGLTGAKKLKGDSNPNADYYNFVIPANATGSPRLIKVYGYSLRASQEDGILVLQVYQA